MYQGVQNVRIDGQIMGYNGLSNGNADILSKLQPGDTIRAQVINTTGNEAVLKLSDGTKFTANTLNPQLLKAGEHMNFSVKGFSDGRLVLETVKNTVQQAETDPLASIKNILSEQDIPATEENIKIAKALSERNVPITRESVAQTATVMKANTDIDAKAASFVTAARMNDNGSIEKLKNLLAGRLKIGNDINELVKLINQHLTGDFSQELSDITTNLKSLINLLNNRDSSSQQTNLLLQKLTQLLGELTTNDGGLSNSLQAMAKGAGESPATTGATANPAATSAAAGQPNVATGTGTDVAASGKAAAGSASANTANAGTATATQSGAQNSATAPLAGQNNATGAQAGPKSASAQTAQAAATLNVDSAKLDAATTGGTAAGMKAADPQQAGNVQGGISSAQGQNSGMSAAQAQAQNVAQTAAQVGDGAGASVQAQSVGGAGAMQGTGGAVGTASAQNAAGALAQGGNRPEQRIGTEPSDNKALISKLDSLKSSLSSLSSMFKDNALIKQLDAQTANLLSKLHNMESLAEQSPHKELKAQADNLKGLFVKLDSDDNQLLNPMKLFKDLQDSVSNIKNLASQLSGFARDSMMNLSGSLDSNMSFLNQLNNYSSYMQLPLSMFNKDTTGELYMLKRGSKSKKLDPSNLTVLISLDSENAGRIDTLLSIDKKDISTNFRLENSDIFPILKENHRELYNSLLSKGYRLVDYTFKLLDEPINIVNFEAEAQKEFIKKPNSIDITL